MLREGGVVFGFATVTGAAGGAFFSGRHIAEEPSCEIQGRAENDSVYDDCFHGGNWCCYNGIPMKESKYLIFPYRYLK